MISSTHSSAALLSVVFPGLGQFANGRFVRGAAFLVAALSGSIALVTDATNPASRVMVAAALVGLSLWSIADAFRAPS